MPRTYCGEIRESHCGTQVSLSGWVDSKRDLGGLIFIKLRDISGHVQIIFDFSQSSEKAVIAEKLKSEYVVEIKGTVRKRTRENINPEMPTGTLEVEADTIMILNESLPLPFQIDTRESLNEELRLSYRFLDLRRGEMREALLKRHQFMQATRNYLSRSRFIEIETPVLNRSTPEGARDYLVPSRISRGEFYALPQSPQLFKQILMVSGYDRYFQIVKCFRDEDLRNDRQPEFTQIDLELSFCDEDMIIEIIEGLLKETVSLVLGREIPVPFPRITFDEAMSKYGCDAPDCRFGLELKELNAAFADSQFRVFSSVADKGLIKGFCAPDTGIFSRKKTDELSEEAKLYGAGGLPFVKYTGGEFSGGFSKFLSEAEKKSLLDIFSPEGDSIMFFAADRPSVVNQTLSKLRKKIASECGLIDENKLAFTWVTAFPLFEHDGEQGRFVSVHHPFTAPFAKQREMLASLKPAECGALKARAYDIVLNGSEIGGGSIRICEPGLQAEVFALLGIGEEEAREKFSFLLEALKYGAPPHGGLALGLDRIMMILLKRDSIRDVIPFPKTSKGQCLMSGAPSAVSQEQLDELGLRIVPSEKA